MSAAWWSYVRRVGDEIAVKDFDVVVGQEALDALIAEELTDDRLDDLVQHMGRAFKPEMTRRSGFTSELFPMLPYMSLSVIEDFHSYAERVAVIDAAMPAEELGRRLREGPNRVSPLWIWMVGYHFLCGRELLIHMGSLAPRERREEIRTVVDFWRRLTLAHRGDGTLDYKDAGSPTATCRRASSTSWPAPRRRWTRTASKALKRLNATISGYSFLYFCDSRVGICDSGPYPLATGGGDRAGLPLARPERLGSRGPRPSTRPTRASRWRCLRPGGLHASSRSTTGAPPSPSPTTWRRRARPRCSGAPGWHPGAAPGGGVAER